METEFEPLLDDLWRHFAPNLSDLENKLRSCFKGFASANLLQSLASAIAEGDHMSARLLLTRFLTNHPALPTILRRLELVAHFQKNRTPSSLELKNKQRSKEALITKVNALVTANKFLAAEQLLIEAIEVSEVNRPGFRGGCLV